MTAAEAKAEAFLRETIAGLSAAPRKLPGKFLWDEAGSTVFDRICAHPDYYPARRELGLLQTRARELAALVGPGVTIIEFGSGASRKVRTLLDAMERPARYIAIDISDDYLKASVGRLQPDFPDIEMIPVCADYSLPVRIPVRRDGPVLGFFPGTSIGNVSPPEAQDLLARIRETLGPSRLLVSADPTQDEALLRKAYGDCGGLMPEFHLNVLERLRRELGAEIDIDAFRHEAPILREPFRMEARLVATRPTTWRLGGHRIAFAEGESIRTDVSHKYTPKAFRSLATRAGWTREHLWLDSDRCFALHLLKT